MQRQAWGRIINVVGMAARVPVGIMSGVRNAAVVAMSRNVAEQLGQYGITVNVVHPFAVRTERSISQVRELADREGISFEAAEQRRLADGNLLRRTIDAAEIGFVVAFLASPKGVAVNGEAIAVDRRRPPVGLPRRAVEKRAKSSVRAFPESSMRLPTSNLQEVRRHASSAPNRLVDRTSRPASRPRRPYRPSH